MPAKPQWLLHIPMIVDQLRSLDAPVVDRASCERLFGVRRRRAIDLMHFFGGYQSGNTVLLDRYDLIRRLESLDAGPEVCQERQRKARLSDQLRKLQRHHAAVSVVIPVLPVLTPTLPASVRFGAGQMMMDFDSVEDLLSKLYALAQAAVADFEAFRAVVNGLP